MSKEAMKLALEAFEWNYNTDLDNIPACEQWAKMLKKNITSLRQAIEQAQQDVDWEKLYRLEVKKKEAIAAKYEQDIKPLTKIVPMAQQVEPALDCTKVACMGNNGCVGTCWNKDTSPSPRQPLTDEQVWDAYMEISAEFDCNVIDLVEFARAIEAKLKEKNT